MTELPNELSNLLGELARSLAWQAELGAFGVPRESTVVVEARPPEVRPDRVEGGPPRGRPPGDGRVGESPSRSSTDIARRASSNVPPLAVPSLDEIRAEIGDCRRCKLCDDRNHIVFGVGNPNARLMFIGEAPGRDEDRQGIPFVGRAGQLLTRMIAAMGLTRDDVYIANIIKCRPPQNRDPEPDEIIACEPFLKKQIDTIRPDVIVSLGRVSAQTLLRIKTPIGRLRGRWRNYHGVKLMPTFHPAYLLRNPAGKKDVWNDLQAVMAELGLERPDRGR